VDRVARACGATAMRLPGDADGCGQLATRLARAAAGVERARRLQQQGQSAVGDWEGAAARAFADIALAYQQATSQLAVALHAAGQALAAFAAELRRAQALAARAGQVAMEAGLVVGPAGSIAPVTLSLDLSASDDQTSQAALADGLVRDHARDEALRLIRLARDTERVAHDSLRAALQALLVPPLAGAFLGSTSRWIGVGDPVPGLRTLGPPSESVFGWSTWQPGITDPVDALGLAARAPERMQLRADKLLATGEGNVRRLHGDRVTIELVDKAWGRLPDGWGIGRSLGVVGAAFTAVDVFVESHDKKVGPERALTKAVLTTAAASAGYATGFAAAGALGMTGVGAPVAVAIVTGIAVSWGVGKLVDHWRDTHPRTPARTSARH